jgi:hypothetical protein
VGLLAAAIHKENVEVLWELCQEVGLAEVCCVANVAAKPLAPNFDDLRHNSGVLFKDQLGLYSSEPTQRGTSIMDDIDDADLGSFFTEAVNVA